MSRRRNKIAPAVTTAVPPDAALGRQTTSAFGIVGGESGFGGWGSAGLSDLYANGGSARNPMGFAGYDRPWRWTEETYIAMLRDPVVWAAYMSRFAPVLANSWSYVPAHKGVPKAMADRLALRLATNLDPLRRRIIANFGYFGLNFGRAGGELAWDVAGGEYRLVDVVPQRVVLNGVYRDVFGRFAGLAVPLVAGAGLTLGTVSGVQGGLPGLPAPYKSVLYCHQDPLGSLRGQPWLYHAKQPWVDKLDAMQQLQRLSSKISGRQSKGKGPAGKIPGTQSTYAEKFMEMMTALANGADGVFIPTLGLTIGPGGLDPKSLDVQALLASLFDIEIIDYGTNSPAIASMIDRIVKANAEIVLASARAARTVLEGESGARSETETKTDSATVVSELDDEEMAEAMQPVVDAICVLNEGEQARGTMRILTPPLDQSKKASRIGLQQQVLAMSNTDAQAILLEKLGNGFFEQVCDDCGANYNADFDMDEALQRLATPPVSPPPEDPDLIEPAVGNTKPLSDLTHDELLAHAERLVNPA